ncbi:MAG: hypothetical protein CVV41_09595 [Candidatus Riflebacteria bacterium HGW-Riflebacteria-1]|nr:MAG: hypothetical protein CVV41_09595 [Candidatus Riflebacteria bacterium HGW-Riflebacteria-1]
MVSLATDQNRYLIKPDETSLIFTKSSFTAKYSRVAFVIASDNDYDYDYKHEHEHEHEKTNSRTMQKVFTNK